MKFPFRTHAFIRWIGAMNLVLWSAGVVKAQCPAGSTVNSAGTYNNGQTVCITTNFSGDISLNNGATLYIANGGNYTGNLSTNNGSVVQVATGGRLAPSQANSFSASLSSSGTVVMNNITLNNGAAITNSGSFTWAGNWNQNNAITVSNTACGTMTFSQSTNLGSNAAINNNGVLNFSQSLTTSSGTTINNRGRVTVAGDINLAGTFYNQNIAVFRGGNNNISSGNTNDSLVNLGEITITGSITTSIGTRNEGLVVVNGSYTINGNYFRINNSNAQLRIGGALSNNGEIRGTGSLHVGGGISNNQTIAGVNGANRLTTNQNISGGTTQHLTVNGSLIAADTATYTPERANPDACIALPVKLSSLQAAYHSGQVQLNWSANSGSDIRSFTIEYSQDGQVFTRAGELAATGQNDQNTPYVYMHAPAVTGTVFYRVRSTALDGKMYYSNTVVVKTGNTLLASATVFPNPFTDILQISMQLEKAGMIQVALYNAGGELVRKQQHAGVLGRNTVVISDLSALPAGSYLVQMKAGNHTSFRKLIK
ncbi:T9SS type A sorting domain-containing protein [Longitalea luteola]|uniref:T9SS type A sorting domain-containing protein n=1 Tax=Longitalea luteola TaxID=2812563 RepID=UPI001A9671A0|nr:T9SS type A sorting domain-containing protein [Longitalea luteola]